MATKPRSPGQTAISVSVPTDLLRDIDTRAESLGLNRSQYLAQLARADLLAKGAMLIHETNAPPVKPLAPVADADSRKTTKLGHRGIYKLHRK